MIKVDNEESTSSDSSEASILLTGFGCNFRLRKKLSPFCNIICDNVFLILNCLK